MRSPLASAAAALALAAAATTAPAQRAATPAALSASPDAFVPPATPPPATIAPAEYATRRAALARQMGDGVLVVLGEDEPDADYLPFAQTPPMRYLAGVTEPGAVLLIGKRGSTVRELLFVRPRNPAREV